MPILGVNRCHTRNRFANILLISGYTCSRPGQVQGHFASNSPHYNVSSSGHGGLIIKWHQCPRLWQGLWWPWCACVSLEARSWGVPQGSWLLLHVFSARGDVLVNLLVSVSHLKICSEPRGGVMQHCDCRAAAEWLIDESSLQQFYGPGTHSSVFTSDSSLSGPLELLPTYRVNCRDIGSGIKHEPGLEAGCFNDNHQT